MKVAVKFTGGEELARKLALLADKPKRQATLRGLKAGAEPIRARASQYAPQSETDGDHLADHILIGVRPATEDSRLDADTSVGIGVPKKFFYDAFLEFGTRRIAATPFYRPAFDLEAPNAIDTMAKVYWETLST